MAVTEKNLTTEQIYAAPVNGILDLTIAANQMASDGENPYEARNAVILAEKKRQIIYKNGCTLAVGASILLNEAASNIRHSRKLSGNMHSADKTLKRPKHTDAHHVVAAQDPRAKDAREILIFIWLIGINDAANGIYMRRFPRSKVRGLSKCPPHQGEGHIHTNVYHLTVLARLQLVFDQNASIGRTVLRSIASEILAGTFPY